MNATIKTGPCPYSVFDFEAAKKQAVVKYHVRTIKIILTPFYRNSVYYLN